MSRKSTKLISPYHNCGRCGCTRQLKELQWELGVLVCSTGGCKDTELVGEREAQISQILENSSDNELAPDAKLLNPSDSASSDDIMF